MRLFSRQVRLYNLRADLFPPVTNRQDADGGAKDVTFGPQPESRLVPCYRIDSQEDNIPTAVGRGKGPLVINAAQFKFPYQVPIGDGYLIRLLLVPGPALRDGTPAQTVYRFYIVLGEAQDRPAAGRRRGNQRKVFATETYQVATVDNTGITVLRPNIPTYGAGVAAGW